MRAIPQEAEILKGVMNLLHEIARCQNADANVAAVAMVYVCIDTMAFLAMPADQMTQGKTDFITWVDNYLKADPSQPYQYRGIDVYAARCSLLHAFSAETEAHRKDPSVRLFGYADNGAHAFNSAESTRLVIISVAVLIHDLSKQWGASLAHGKPISTLGRALQGDYRPSTLHSP
jgi:hypothetical protein